MEFTEGRIKSGDRKIVGAARAGDEGGGRARMRRRRILEALNDRAAVPRRARGCGDGAEFIGKAVLGMPLF